MNNNFKIIESKGKEIFGEHFTIYSEDSEVINKLLTWFLKDEKAAQHFNINLNKGILLTGPIGCGKTSLFTLIRLLLPPEDRFIIKSCREVTFDFIKDGYEIIQRYSTNAYNSNDKPNTTCFDDLGAESEIKYYGNQCNVMGEILLSRYDHFINNRMITHATTNLSASELENYYGNRVRSRMREMFNLIAYDAKSTDKRR
jgi:energy-coupling factor transporter ATP-binding protein EcfA2